MNACDLVLFFASLCKIAAASGDGLASDIGTCQSEYLEQPPNQLSCNPYLNMELKLECTVRVSLESDSLASTTRSISVSWFHSGPSLLHQAITTTTSNSLPISRLDNAQEDVLIQEQRLQSGATLRVRSRLELPRLNGSANDVGQYWCGIRVDSMEWMVLSDPVTLQGPTEYKGLPACSTTVAQSKMERKCAGWSFNPSATPASQTLPSPSPPPPPPPPLSPQPTTAAATLSFSESPPGPEPSTPASVGPTTTSSTATEDDTSPGEDDGSLMEFYVAVGILVAFAAIITTLASLVTCTCIKYRRVARGETFDWCFPYYVQCTIAILTNEITKCLPNYPVNYFHHSLYKHPIKQPWCKEMVPEFVARTPLGPLL